MTAGGGVSAFPGAAILLLIRTVRSGRGGARTEPEPGVPAPRPPGGRESPSRVHYLCLKSQEDFLWVSDLEPWWSFSAERPGAPPDPPPETRSAAGETKVLQFTAQERDNAEWPEGVYYEGKSNGGVEEVYQGFPACPLGLSRSLLTARRLCACSYLER
ncbi:uncharacterized protein [Lepidochelys kempii]|uniref:uncharacterized protein isoform X4 n=1 Tax=Lepidochelys kempii TaxID=8472 RepID=UPI003C6F3EE3